MDWESYIITPSGRLEIIGTGVTFSTNDSLEVATRFSHDGTGHSHSITRRVRNTALGASLRWATNHQACVDANVNMFDYLADIENLCGRLITVVFNGTEYKNMLVTNVGCNLSIDTVDIYEGAEVTLSLEEGYIKKKADPYTVVKAQYTGEV